MFMFLKLGAPVLILITMTSSVRRSEYLKTKVILENSKCSSQYSALKISTITTKSALHCGDFCSSDGACRRYLFNSRLKQCQLFDSGNNCYVYDEEELESTACFRLKFLCDDKNSSRCPIGYYGDDCQHLIKGCREGVEIGVVPLKTMMSFIRPSQSLPVTEVKCDFRYSSAVILCRLTNCKEVDFNRTWDEYVSGFGDPHGNNWIGLEFIYSLSKLHTSNRLGLHATMTSPNRNHKIYYGFNIANNSDDYRIHLSYSNNPGHQSDDIFTSPGYSLDGRPFSTYDRDLSSHNCPDRFNGGWWFLDNPNCSLVNLVGRTGYETYDGNWFWFDNNGRYTDFKRLIVKLSPTD